MDIQIQKEKITDIVDHAESIIERRNTIPILSNILIQAKDGILRVRSTDLDIMVTESTDDLTINVEGETTVSGNTFLAVLKKLPAKSVVTLKAEDGFIHLVAGRSRYKLPTLPSSDFPLIPSPEGKEFQVKTEDLKNAFQKVKSSISTEETRYYLNGAYLAIQDKHLIAVATDGHRLSLAQIADFDEDTPNVIVPRKAVNELIKLLGSYDGVIVMTISEAKIEISIGTLTLLSKLVDGTFPDYNRVIPDNPDIDVHVDPKTLYEAIDRISVVSNEKTRSVTFDISEDKIILRVLSPENGNAEEQIAATSTKAIKVGYNGRYMMDILDNYKDYDTICISMSGETAPALIRPDVNGVDLSVIMPMRI